MPLTPRSHRIAFVVVLIALTVGGAASAPQRGLNQADGVPTGPRTGLIVGQVVDSAGAPVPEAIVYMSLPKYFADLPTTPKGLVMADAEGRFFFSDLPAGDYYLRAIKDGYGGGESGQRRPTGRGQRVELREGERRSDATLTLWKHAVIGGMVLDEAGEPVIGVSVQALVKDVVNGRVRYGTMSYLVPTATTDDRGMFRLSQLMPGRYVVVVPSTQTTVPAALLGAISQDYGLRVEFSAAIAETAPLGSPRTQQVGDFALLTPNRVVIPPPASPAGRMEVYRTTYFPAVTTANAASAITVEGGEERTDLKIGLRPVPAVKISGRLVTPDGTAPPPMAVRLVGEAAADVGEEGFETVTGLSDARGRFTLLGVPAGEYVLKQANRLLSAARLDRTAWWVTQRVTVGASDIQDLTVSLRPALRVEGRSELRGGPNSTTPVRPPLVMFETPFGDPGRMVGQQGANGDLSFATLAVAGQYVALPSESGGWFVKSVTLDGKDITDRVFDLQSDATNIVVTYTDRASKVSGVVKDARGDVSTTAIVLAFPVDPQLWSGYGSSGFGSSPRTLKNTRVSRTGAYSFAGLPAGDYYVVAIDDADADGWTDPKTLESLARQGTKLTIVDVEAKTVDLTVKAIR